MTKISKLHFNGIDYDIGEKDIHDLTAKTTINANDEFMISDSEDWNAHKKLSASKLLAANVELLVVWWWGGGGYTNCSTTCWWWGWGAWWLIHFDSYPIATGAVYDVKVWTWGAKHSNGNYSSFWIVAAHWWWGWACATCWGTSKDWGSWWGANACGSAGVKYTYCPFEKWNNWWVANSSVRWGWWGGAGTSWYEGSACCGLWWCWLEFDISWENVYYSTWWNWWGIILNPSTPWGWKWWCTNTSWTDGSTPWSWWWGAGCVNSEYCNQWWAWHWADWIVIVRYPTACWYNLNWWIKYTCGGNTIHCFEADWQFWAIGEQGKFINFLLVWWGGGWAWISSTFTWTWWGWGGWAVVECKWYEICSWSYNVKVWAWWPWFNTAAWYNCSDWWPSCFGDIVACWWGGGWLWCVAACPWYCNWRTWGNWWWGWGAWWQWWVWTQWYDGWSKIWWWWGAGWAGFDGDVWTTKRWWLWIRSKIEWEWKWYSWWWAGGCCAALWCCWACYWWWQWASSHNNCNCANATYYGWWGGWLYKCASNYHVWGNGCQWVFIISYPKVYWGCISGWNCCYECNWRCIHIFTSDWTLTVS